MADQPTSPDSDTQSDAGDTAVAELDVEAGTATATATADPADPNAPVEISLEPEPLEMDELTSEEREERAREIGIRPDLYDDDYSPDEYEAMLEMYEETLSNVEEGEIVSAKVLRVTENAVILDVGFKSEGSVPRDEFKDPDALEAGEEVDVFLESLEDDEGVVVLSKKKADFLRVWEKIKAAHEKDEPVPGKLVRKIKGGVTVDLMGVDAFLPGSQIALRRVPNIEDLIGNTYRFKIIKLNKRRRNIVVSRRVILEAEREVKRDQLVKELLVGQVREGIVKNVTDFGAFIDLGGLDGLLHITDMSWGRVGHPSELLSIGDKLDVKVLDVDWNRERISLGLKQLLPYPWKGIAAKYPVGSRVRGRVVSITNYGAFVELERGVEGLVHVSEMSWTRNVRHPSQLVGIGDEIEAVVLKVDPGDEKISLGMKQIEEDPWLTLPVKYPTGTKVEGTVRNLTSFGAFVEIEPGIDGLIHVSDMSWTKRIEHPSEVLRKGDEVEVVVLNIDPENKRISLGLKQLEDDPWNQISDRFAPGVESDGKVVRFVDNGVVVDLGDDIEGFVPVSQIGVEGLEDASDHLSEGQALSLRVLESDPVNRRIVLACTEIPERTSTGRRTKDEDAEEEGEEPEAQGDEAPRAEADEEPEAEADEEPEAEADEEPEAEADEEPEAEADEEPEAEADEEPE
ncbi:MAG TPA: 30S ribosomal protein S1, partial [Longimicrobiales bacterium]|nr:30S ribosomal protein S1 [Longimicrobiales bacterium]